MKLAQMMSLLLCGGNTSLPQNWQESLVLRPVMFKIEGAILKLYTT
jgi:hypothetical protein